jgi:kynurenine formamidase
LAGQLIDSARNKRVVDLSVPMSNDLPVWWPGRGIGNHRQPYYKIDFLYAPHLDLFHHTHMLDSHTGTHLVPPAYALPEEGFDNSRYAPQVREWLAEYEDEFGARGTSSVTAEQVPLEQTCGRARVIDARALVGTTDAATWPASPQITPEHVRGYEQRHGKLNAGEIVIFYTGHTDKHFKAFPEGTACLADPLAGKSEGWPAPTAQTIVYLAERGIRCVATDGPTLGGVDPKQALFTYWAMGSRGMVGVEFLTGVGQVPEKAYFLFAPLKIRGCHGGPGRAIALY